MRTRRRFQGCSPIVRIVLKALLVIAACAVTLLSVCLGWLYFYSGDLPHFAAVATFAPDSPTSVTSRFGGPVTVIRWASLGASALF